MGELVWSDRFDAEVQSIYEWLEERNEGSGDEFYRSLLTELNQLVRHPWSGSRIKDSNARHLLVVGRWYAVIHTVEHRGIILQALFDQRRNPEVLARAVREITGGLPGPSSGA